MNITLDSSRDSILASRFFLSHTPLALTENNTLEDASAAFEIGSSSLSGTPEPRPRRVKRHHKKSRRGCFSCKSRRIKCQETKPACANCIHKRLECVYPTNGEFEWQTNAHRYTSSNPPSQVVPFCQQISTTPFTGDDLRFWHHFLADARPTLPWGSEDAWMSEIPASAHDCPPLLHAILSHGASDCALVSPHGSQYYPIAMMHRGKALQGLGEILAKGDDCTVTEMDSALATCYTLTFQAHTMADGIIDFAVMVRGCSIVTNWFFDKNKSRKSNLFNIQGLSQAGELMTSSLPEHPCQIKDPTTVDACISSLDKLQPYLQTPAHQNFYSVLRRGYQALLDSYQDAFTGLMSMYGVWYNMGNAEFLDFIAPRNFTTRALLIHFVTFDVLVRPVHVELGRARNIKTSGGDFLIYRWVEAVFETLPLTMQRLVHAPIELVALNLAPELELSRLVFPRWNYELAAFEEWLRRRLPSVVDIESC